MATTRLDRAIARLRAMSHEEYTDLLNRHSTSNNVEILEYHMSLNDTESAIDSYVLTFETALIHSGDRIPTYNANYLHNDSEKFGASFEAPNFYNVIIPSETYQNAA